MILELEDGKYTYLEGGLQSVLRYGQPWRDVTGDKFIGAMAAEIERLRAELAESQAREHEPIHQWSRVGTGLWHDGSREECYERVDEHYEARTLYAVLVPPAEVVMPEGWALVPVTSTTEMDFAGGDAGSVDRYTAEFVWNAMLAAAPKYKGEKP